MTHISNVHDCTGCNACKAVCNNDAIIQKQKRGFIYNYIDSDKCSGCNLCKEVCPVLNDSFLRKTIKRYAVKLKEDALKSQSGGAAWALMLEVLKDGGSVYGCEELTADKIVYSRCVGAVDAERLRQVKYVQADCERSVYESVGRDLLDKIIVMFVGTPCQCEGIRRYLATKKINQDKLYLVDIICHGVPSAVIYRDYINYLQNKYKMEIKKVVFRDKSFGWGSHIETVIFESNKKIHVDMWRQLFYSSRIIRESCGKCRYACGERVGDFSIGDCWNILNYNPDFWDRKGVSTVLINSTKASSLFENIKNNIEWIEIDEKTATQHNMQFPTALAEDYDSFWDDYAKNGFEYIYSKYTKEQHYSILGFWIKAYYRGFLRRIKK